MRFHYSHYPFDSRSDNPTHDLSRERVVKNHGIISNLLVYKDISDSKLQITLSEMFFEFFFLESIIKPKCVALDLFLSGIASFFCYVHTPFAFFNNY